MKKRIIFLMITILAVVAVAVVFSACNNFAPVERTIQVSLQGTLANATQDESGHIIITYKYGETIDISKDDFKVQLLYESDQDAPTLLTADQYTMDTSAVAGTPDAGTYAVTFSYNDFETYIDVVVEAITIAMPIIPDRGECNIEFTGGEINCITDLLDPLQTSAGLPTISQLLAQGVITIEDCSEPHGTTATSQTHVNLAQEYFFNIKTAKNYYFVDESGNLSDVVSVYWEITPKKIALPTYGSTQFTYTGEEITFELNWTDGYENIKDFIMIPQGSTTGATEVGEYSLNVIINPDLEYPGDYVFADGTTSIIIYWSIVGE
ncbi:MAG: hypothetical protein ACI4M5_06130 [Christensenellales bacterium]